ncbi:MAG: hypothetical protein V3T71_03700 [Dehalococcoidia bacterium]
MGLPDALTANEGASNIATIADWGIPAEGFAGVAIFLASEASGYMSERL